MARAVMPSGSELSGRQLEAIGNNGPREMIAHDKIRLTPPPMFILPKPLQERAFSGLLPYKLPYPFLHEFEGFFGFLDLF